MLEPYVRPGIDDRPDYEHALSPEDQAAVRRLAFKDNRRPPESAADQAEAQASAFAAAGSPASAVASVDAAVPDMTSAFLDMRDPMVAADGERPAGRALTRMTWGFALASLLTTVPWVALTIVGLPAVVARAVLGDRAALAGAAPDPWGTLAVPLGVIVAVGALVHVVAGLYVAAGSDRTRLPVGRRTPWFVAGCVLCALLALALGKAGSLVIAGVVWALLAVAHAMVEVPLDAAFSERVPDKHRVALVRWRGVGRMVGQTLGAAVGVLSVAFGSARLGYATYAAVAVCFALAAVVTVAVCPPEPSSVATRRVRFRQGELLGRMRPTRPTLGFTLAWVSRLCLMAAVGLTTVFLWYLVRYWAGAAGAGVPLTMDLRLAPWAMVVAMAVCALMGSGMAARVAGPINESFDDVRWPLLVGCLLFAASLLLPLAMPNVAALAIFALIAGFAFGLVDALGQELVMAALPDPRTAGRDLGVLNLANGLGLVAAAGIGAAALTYGGFAALFVCGIVLMAATAALLWFAGR